MNLTLSFHPLNPLRVRGHYEKDLICVQRRDQDRLIIQGSDDYSNFSAHRKIRVNPAVSLRNM